MILQALYDRYRKMPGKTPIGFQKKEIPFIIVIDEEGTFIRVDGLGANPNGPVLQYLVPSEVKRTSGIKPFILWDKPSYILGLSENDSDEEEAEKTRQRLDAFRAKVDEIAAAYPDDAGLRAVKAFYDREEYLRITQDATTVETIHSAKGAYLTFRVSRQNGSTAANPLDLVANSQAMKDYQANHFGENYSGGDEGICLITGSRGPISRIHPAIKFGRQNPSLVNFQEGSGYDSYGKTQALNAPISPVATEGYVTALNDLLTRGKSTNYFLAGTTYVFWSSDLLHEKELADHFRSATFDPPMTEKPEEEAETGDHTKKRPRGSKRAGKNSSIQVLDQKRAKEVLDALRAIVGERSSVIRTDSAEKFYLLALEPGKGRISVKLFVEATIKEISAHILQHLEDMKIYGRYVKSEEDDPEIRSIYSLIASAMPEALGADKWPKRPIDGLIRSITTGAPYPADLYSSCLRRIITDRSVTELRAAFLKAYINRNNRLKHNNNQTITMALDKTQTNKGYLAGRLFAVLEDIQENANNGKATITDSYFGAAGTTPAYIFPRLLSLSNHHLSKIRRESSKGLDIYFSKLIQEIMDLMGGDSAPYPTRFTLEEQGFFGLGYYHQKQYRYRSKEEKEKETQE